MAKHEVLSAAVLVALALPALAEGPVTIDYNGVPGQLHYWEVGPYTIDYVIDLADGRTIEARNVELRPFKAAMAFPSVDVRKARGEDIRSLVVTDAVPMEDLSRVLARYRRDYDVVVFTAYPEGTSYDPMGSKGDCSLQDCVDGAVFGCAALGQTVKKLNYDNGSCRYTCSDGTSSSVECVDARKPRDQLDLNIH